MTVVRWGRGELAGTITAGSKVRWGRSELSGTAPTGSKVRWGRSELSGTTALTIAPITPPAPIEPGINWSVTATLSAGTASVWSWRRVSGPAVQLTASGTTLTASSVTFVSPSVMPPTSGTLVLGVTATQGTFTSPERTVTITVLPQIRWVLHDGVWVGRQQVAFVAQPPSDAFTDTFTDDF